MISKKLIAFIEKHAEDLTQAWLKDVQQHTDTLNHHHYSSDRLRDLAIDVYSHLGQWLESDSNRHQVDRIFTELGAERFREGFRVSEVVKSLMMIRNHLRQFVLDHGFLESAADLYQVLELITSVVRFFDRATYCTVRGFETEAHLYRTVPPGKK